MKQAINFDWKFVGDYKEEYLNKLPDSSAQINIPHCAKEVPYNYFILRRYHPAAPALPSGPSRAALPRNGY